MEKILLDTDIGGDIDDAVCLAYLLQEPKCELIGITTVCGEPERRAAVADAICRAAGKEVPVASYGASACCPASCLGMCHPPFPQLTTPRISFMIKIDSGRQKQTRQKQTWQK